MKLLIVTQKVNKEDPILGFFHRWIEEFAKHVEVVTVICLEKGDYSLPENVKVLSLGKEEGNSALEYLKRFYSHIWNERGNYDAVFVHMNPEYAILGGPLWRLWGKRMGLWYVHKAVNPRIWLAEKLANVVFTSAPESFQLKSKKVQYVGHGIDAEQYKFSPMVSEKTPLLYVGRITRIKNLYAIVKGTKGWPLTLVGEPVTEDDRKYKKEIESLAEEVDADLKWFGAVPNYKMSEIYQTHSASINASPDGGMDKSVLESLASGCPAFVKNTAFRNVYGENFSTFNFQTAEDLEQKITNFLERDDKEQVAESLSRKIHSEYGVGSVISKIISGISNEDSR
ncbi:MAG: glycosyltransferase [Thermodesulfobacteriota bacterium]